MNTKGNEAKIYQAIAEKNISDFLKNIPNNNKIVKKYNKGDIMLVKPTTSQVYGNKK